MLVRIMGLRFMVFSLPHSGSTLPCLPEAAGLGAPLCSCCWAGGTAPGWCWAACCPWQLPAPTAGLLLAIAAGPVAGRRRAAYEANERPRHNRARAAGSGAASANCWQDGDPSGSDGRAFRARAGQSPRGSAAARARSAAWGRAEPAPPGGRWGAPSVSRAKERLRGSPPSATAGGRAAPGYRPRSASSQLGADAPIGGQKAALLLPPRARPVAEGRPGVTRRLSCWTRVLKVVERSKLRKSNSFLWNFSLPSRSACTATSEACYYRTVAARGISQEPAVLSATLLSSASNASSSFGRFPSACTSSVTLCGTPLPLSALLRSNIHFIL